VQTTTRASTCVEGCRIELKTALSVWSHSSLILTTQVSGWLLGVVYEKIFFRSIEHSVFFYQEYTHPTYNSSEYGIVFQDPDKWFKLICYLR
jgi:hypothetical protein